ncbi:MAG: DMT family transporter [Herbaspirillum huttiense]|uniref:DMT family transporter n=1 Tax=Herbaspirillum huttiense TaxID=863372 RepID=UPI001ACB60F8|nr:DMT family transporter [Herbaspirillum huttiense]MBN9355860.1 DMT family transporter [Herbaspirillum huttiense]
MHSLPKSAVAALLLNTFIWGLSWTGTRALEGMGLHPVWATAAIFSGCALLLLTLRHRELPLLWRHPALLGVGLATGLTNASFNMAVAYGDVVRVILLFYLMPVWTVILARLVLHEAITPRSLARVALGLGGAFIVLYQPRLGLPLPQSLPDWMAVASGLLFAVTNVLLRRLHGFSDGTRAVAMLVGSGVFASLLGVVLSAAGVVAWPLPLPMAAAPVVALWAVLFLVSNLSLQYGVARLPANIAAVIMLAEILVATFSAWMLGAAELRPQDLIGGVLIITAPWIVRDRRVAVQPA